MMNKNNLDPDHSTGGSGGGETRYKGVRRRKWGKWVSEIRLPNSRERIWLGSYDSQEKAAKAFDAALFCLRGCHAKFNFPDQPPDIVDAHSLTTHQIQEVAAKFANDYSPSPIVAKPPDHTDHTDIDTDTVPSLVKDENMDWSFLDNLGAAIHHPGPSSPNLFASYSDQFDRNIITNELYGTHDRTLLEQLDHDHHYHYHYHHQEQIKDDYDVLSVDDSYFSNQPSFLWNFEN